MKRDPVYIGLAFIGLGALAALVFAGGRMIEQLIVKVLVPQLWIPTNIPFRLIGQSIFFALVGAASHKIYTHFYPAEKTDKERSSYNAFRSRTYPNPFPNGWYTLAFSKDVPTGTVISVEALGQHFAIFRGESGEIGVVNAYCPHMGANLTVGGKVCGDTIECPFHRWRFATNGDCVAIPYSERQIPRNAQAKSYHSQEYHGMICVYFDAEGREPAYELPIQKDIESGQLVYRGELDAGIVRMHIQEFADNAADWMHFDPIHGHMMFPFTRYEIPIIHRWLHIKHIPGTVIGSEPDATKYGPNDKHFLYFLNAAQLTWNGKVIPETDANAVITFCGPAGINIFRFTIPRFGQIVMFQTHLPEEDVKQRVRFHWYADRQIPRVIVWYVVGLWVSQWSNDIDIWENKVHYKKPCLVAGDGPINKVRRWYKQFYSDNSGNVGKDSMDW